MKVQRVKTIVGKGRVFVAGAAASVVPMLYSAAAYAQTNGIDGIGDSAKTELDKVLPVLVTVGGALVLIAAGVATVMVVLRLTKKA